MGQEEIGNYIANLVQHRLDVLGIGTLIFSALEGLTTTAKTIGVDPEVITSPRALDNRIQLVSNHSAK